MKDTSYLMTHALLQSHDAADIHGSSSPSAAESYLQRKRVVYDVAKYTYYGAISYAPAIIALSALGIRIKKLIGRPEFGLGHTSRRHDALLNDRHY
ncbi:hypothetical protein EJ03DRAFT_186525 [Teratosphaeria nubilosa]|uniref:Uncharacterized protein n=1 Tax=Teratosphaeria nubilosa TaxID=161662 RepID=A0A6G1LK23_9PEZI|nr:hypothetical protein EJ03DRAFT_186525 [Teratosphaeria nubilosa]